MSNFIAVVTSSTILALLFLSPIAVYAVGPAGFSGTHTQAQPSAGPHPANQLGIPDIFDGIRSQTCSSGATVLDKWNPVTDTQTSYTLSSTAVSGFCNGRALAWDGTNVWYSVVAFTTAGQADFHGDGLI